MNKWTKLFLNGFLFKEAKTFQLMAQYSKKTHFNLQKVLIFGPLKLQMDGWISGKKGKKTTFTVKSKVLLKVLFLYNYLQSSSAVLISPPWTFALISAEYRHQHSIAITEIHCLSSTVTVMLHFP